MPKQPKLLVGVSGPICAGKTTAARFLERAGFAYSRFSLVIDDEVSKRGLPLTRASRQAVGLDIHERLGQASLAERTLQRASGGRLVVIDGLRFDEDCEFFRNRLGSTFLHIHIRANRSLRLARYEADSDKSVPFAEAERASVEAAVDGLGRRAHATIVNESSVEDLFHSVGSVVGPASHGGDQCQSPSS